MLNLLENRIYILLYNNIIMKIKQTQRSNEGILDYISPWKFQDSSRNEADVRLSKNKILD